MAGLRHGGLWRGLLEEARFSPSLNRLHEVDFGILGSSAVNTPIPLHKIGLV
jgi:hypothetical protein